MGHAGGADGARRSADPELRASLEKVAEEEGGQALHDRLRQVDPARADALDPRNLRRVVRALEIYHATNKKPSELAKGSPTSANYLAIGLTMDRKALYRCIDDRVDIMIRPDSWLKWSGWRIWVREHWIAPATGNWVFI